MAVRPAGPGVGAARALIVWRGTGMVGPRATPPYRAGHATAAPRDRPSTGSPSHSPNHSGWLPPRVIAQAAAGCGFGPDYLSSESESSTVRSESEPSNHRRAITVVLASDILPRQVGHESRPGHAAGDRRAKLQ